MSIFEAEIITFNKNKKELLKIAKNKYVLIKGSDVLGVFESDWDAIADGYKRLGNVPFLVKQILRVEKPINLHVHIGL